MRTTAFLLLAAALVLGSGQAGLAQKGPVLLAPDLSAPADEERKGPKSSSGPALVAPDLDPPPVEGFSSRAGGGLVAPDLGNAGSPSATTSSLVTPEPRESASTGGQGFLNPQKGPEPVAAPETQPDGSIRISPVWLAAEFFTDEDSAERRYRHKVLEFEGSIGRLHRANETLWIQVHGSAPGLGTKVLACSTEDASSLQSAAALEEGDPVSLAGIYEPSYFAGYTKKQLDLTHHVQTLAMEAKGKDLQGGHLNILNTLRFDDCLVLTGHPDPEGARALLARDARRAE